MMRANIDREPVQQELRHEYLALTHRRRLYSGLILLIFLLMMLGAWQVAEERNAGKFVLGLSQVLDFPLDVITETWEKIDRMPGHLLRFLPSLIETLNIALVSTLVGALFGLLFALLATRSLALWPMLVPVFRRIMDILRALPEIVIALVLIFILGGGPIPAMIAIALHTMGALGKLFSEVAENADLKPVEGLASTGASWLQKMTLGVVPQVLPNFISYGLLRLEVNIRASAILGFVGAGGIGYDLRNTMTWGQGRFDQAAAIFILLFLTIVIVDQISSFYRNRFVDTQHH